MFLQRRLELVVVFISIFNKLASLSVYTNFFDIHSSIYTFPSFVPTPVSFSSYSLPFFPSIYLILSLPFTSRYFFLSFLTFIFYYAFFIAFIRSLTSFSFLPPPISISLLSLFSLIILLINRAIERKEKVVKV